MAAVCVAATVGLASVPFAQAPAEVPTGEAVIASAEVTATVKKIDYKTREVTLVAEDGEEYSFMAGDEVKNLAQLKKGDVVKATYAEALAYEVKKGGQAIAPETVVAGEAAELGQKPGAVIASQSTVTVAITAIDRAVPSVTFKGPEGNTQTIKVRYPEKLEGVEVGDTVEITYTEALGLKVEKAAK
jgi:Cu/Ag efflux protein CusF